MRRTAREVFFQNGRKLFFGDRERTAAYVRKNCPEEVKRIIELADEIARRKFRFTLRWDMERVEKPVVFEREIDWLHQPADDPEWIYAFNRMRYWIVLGQAYALTGNEAYAEAFVSQMLHWIRHVRRDDPKCAKAWRTIEAGLRLEYWLKAMCYFEGSPAVTEEVMGRFLQSVEEHAEYLMGVYGSYHRMSNWGVLENHGLFLAGAMLPPSPRAEEYRREALRRLSEEIRIQVYADGTQWEQSPMYHNEVLHDFLDVVLVSRRGGIELPEEIVRKTRDMLSVDLCWQKPGGNEVAMGDSDEIDVRDIVSAGAYLYRDAVLKTGGYQRLDFDGVWELGADAAEEYGAMEAEAPKETAHALWDSGNFYFRSGWDADASFLHFHCGTLGAGHGHSDQLHFDLFGRGEDILCDSGRFTYVDKPERYEFKNPSAHNTCTVDHRDFTVCRDSWACSKLSRPVNRSFRTRGPYGYAEGGHLGYYDLETGGVFVNRRILVLGRDLYVVADEFYAGDPHTYQQYFHFGSAGSVSGEGRRFRFESGRNEAELLLVGGSLTSRLVPTRLSRRYNEAEPNTTLCTELSGNGFTSVFTVISADPAGRAEPLQAEKVPVRSDFKDIAFEDRMIEALNIRRGKQSFTVVVAHQEYASPTDTFSADGCTGFGNVVVFDRAAGETVIGTVLAW